MSKWSIDGDTLTGIADAVRDMRHEKERMTPAEIEAKIRASRLGIPITVSCHLNPETGEWERPAGYPDLDTLDLTDFDGWYLTYDLTKTPGYGWIGIVAANETGNTPFFVERGHIENGAFVTDESHEVISSNYFRQYLDEEDGDVQLWRVRSDHHLTHCHFAANTVTNAQNYIVSLQPCVERVGRMPYVTDLRSEGAQNLSFNTWRYTTYWLERDAVRCGGAGRCTRMDGTWGSAFSLQSLDVSGWDTTNWAVTTLYSCWYACYSLQSLDVSGWDTTNWAVTTLYSCWNACYSLQSLDVSGWDTTNWKVTDTRNTFADCNTLRELTVPESLGVVPTQASNVAEHRPNTPNIETFSGVKIYINHTYAAAYKLTAASLVAILTRLPAVTAARTITLGQNNKLKLTAEEIAIATQKGWTVA